MFTYGHFLLFRDPAALERAQTAIDDRLARAGAGRAQQAAS
jgi:hypothetical protein